MISFRTVEPPENSALTATGKAICKAAARENQGCAALADRVREAFHCVRVRLLRLEKFERGTEIRIRRERLDQLWLNVPCCEFRLLGVLGQGCVLVEDEFDHRLVVDPDLAHQGREPVEVAACLKHLGRQLVDVGNAMFLQHRANFGCHARDVVQVLRVAAQTPDRTSRPNGVFFLAGLITGLISGSSFGSGPRTLVRDARA